MVVQESAKNVVVWLWFAIVCAHVVALEHGKKLGGWVRGVSHARCCPQISKMAKNRY